MASTLGHCSFRRFAYSKPTGPNHPMGPSSPPPFATSRSHSSAPGSGDTVRYAPTVSFHDPGVLLYHAVSGAQSILKLGTPRLLPQREGTTNRPVQQLMTTAEIPTLGRRGWVQERIRDVPRDRCPRSPKAFDRRNHTVNPLPIRSQAFGVPHALPQCQPPLHHVGLIHPRLRQPSGGGAQS
eukprot:CAMPEP_0172084714 /NCGR_PEP_ID=MMETSP1043-20130122/21145_1 /TAXON_ID=464988 /ORGANISM="Hemiselmis andersenii, Strain CCMP441" /LENGTH=181 /DNA_ID=CAMNT_0012746565 /DNA_START=122 /DNA_END=664 /DNA_ORIENTATION=+